MFKFQMNGQVLHHPQGKNNLYRWLQEWFEGQQNGSFHYRPQGQDMMSVCV